MTTDVASSGAGPLASKHAAAGRRLAALGGFRVLGESGDLVAWARGCAPGR